MKKSRFFITKNIGILLLWLASSGSLDCFYALIKIYNFIKIMFFQVAFLDFQNLQEWGRRINDTYTKMNGISEVRPSIFGGRRQIIRPCTLAGHGSWYSCEIDVKSSFWNFLQYFITRLFMKFWWISYEHSRFPIHTENSCQILKKFMWPFHNEIGVYFTWNHSYEFHMNFSWIVHNIMKSTPYLEHPY